MIASSWIAVLNCLLAVWVAATAVAYLQHHHFGRDLRPLVLPIFTSVAYVCIAATFVMDKARQMAEVTDFGWRLIDCGHLFAIAILVNAMTKRSARERAHQ